MEITTQQRGEFLEVSLEGRLDAYWAEHLSTSLDEVVSAGGHRIQIRMASVSYMSSVGIRVLVKFYKQLDSIGGSLHVTEPAAPVRSVLRMAGLETLLEQAARTQAESLSARVPLRIERDEARYDRFDLAHDASLVCDVVGSPEPLGGSAFREEHMRTLRVPPTSFVVGLGAFGTRFDDCESRFGELLAVAGAAAYLPTDGTNVPDYLLSAGLSAPDIGVLYALACDGTFSSLLRFEQREKDDPIPFETLVRHALDISGGEHAGIVMIAESAGLVGASLRRSPARSNKNASMFEHPDVRGWLSFSAEPCYRRHLALVAGVASRSTGSLLSPLLRPLASQPGLSGHFHAAVFPNRPLPKGNIDLRKTVASLFENESLQSVLHLLPDDRAGVGAGQSELVRGACWVSPIGEVRA